MVKELEIWKPIENCIGYEISSIGRVRNNDTGKILKTFLGNNGYHTIKISKYHKNFLVHRLLMIHFVGIDPERNEVNHKNGVKTDNRLENLEWVTHRENRIHAVSTGLITNTTKGIRMHSKLEEMQVLSIRKCLKEWDINKTPCRDIANYFNVSPTLISAIKRRVAWAGLN